MGTWSPGPGPTGGDDTFEADNTGETADGGGGNDTLSGGLGDDTFIGGAGNDTLDGDWGADVRSGGIGDDTYLLVQDADDVITEFAAEGTDTVSLEISATFGSDYVLPDNIENLILLGQGLVPGFFGSGNALANVLDGSQAATFVRL